MRIPREYQSETEKVVFDKFEKGVRKQLIVLATGLGKTYIGGLLAKNPRFKRTLWLTHTEELIDQSAASVLGEMTDHLWTDVLNEKGAINLLRGSKTEGLFMSIPTNQNNEGIHEKLGIIKQDLFNIKPPLVVASIQTLFRRREKIAPDHFDLIIVDEAHYAMAKTWQETLEYFTPQLRIGLTATPERLDGLSLGNLFDEIVVEYGIEYGIKEGYLVELEGVRVKTEISLDTVRTTGGELNSGDLGKVINNPQRNKLIVKEWKSRTAGCPTLAFCVDVQHAQDLAKVFADEGVPSTFVVGDTQLCPDREERIRDFKSGKYQVVTNVMVLTAGFDYPAVACVINARPTKSKTVFLQQVGRGTRPVCNVNFPTAEERIAAIDASSKKKCIILDITDNTKKHNLINTFTLDKDAPIEEKVFKTRQQKQELLFKIAQHRKLTHEQKDTEVVNLLKLPKVRTIRSEKMLEPATPKQLAWLASEGYDVVNNEYTKRDCSEIISNLPAKPYQVEQLRKLGYDVSKGVTFGEYQAVVEKMQTQRNNIRAVEKAASAVKLPFHDIE